MSAPLPPTSFVRRLVIENGLDARGLNRWFFAPGMLFGAAAKWWGTPGRRETRHEGLDVCLYRDGCGRMHGLDEQVRIPVMYDGRIVRIIDDFLGCTIFMDHGRRPRSDARLFTAFGHIRPLACVAAGQIVKEGDIVAAIADFDARRKPIARHLHISMGYMRADGDLNIVDWEALAVHPSIDLMDPLTVFDGKYEIGPFHSVG